MATQYSPYGDLVVAWRHPPHWIQLTQNDGKWYVVHAIWDGTTWQEVFVGNRYGYRTLRNARRVYQVEVGDVAYRQNLLEPLGEKSLCPCPIREADACTRPCPLNEEPADA